MRPCWVVRPLPFREGWGEGLRNGRTKTDMREMSALHERSHLAQNLCRWYGAISVARLESYKSEHYAG
jgi:hypothetical protein